MGNKENMHIHLDEVNKTSELKNKVPNRLKTGSVLLLFFAIIFMSVFFTNFFRGNSEIDFTNLVYYIFLNLGHSFILALVPFILFYIPSILISEKLASILYTIICLFIQTLIIIDSFVFIIYKYHLNMMLIEWFIKAGDDVLYLISTQN